MLRESQVVGGGIVDSVDLVAVVVHGENFGGWAGEHPPVVEPELVLDEIVHVLGATLDALEEIDAFGLSEGDDVDCFEDGLDVDVPLPQAGLGIYLVFLHV